MELIDKDALIIEIEKAEDAPAPSHDQQCDWEDGYVCGLSKAVSIIDTFEVKDVDLEKEMPTSGECVTISKERYQELLEYESVALWAFNVIIVASLPSIEDEKLKEISDDVKCKAIQAAFQEALKNKEDK